MLELQAHRDGPLVEHYCSVYAPMAQEAGIGPEVLRERVIEGLQLGRRLEAADGFELDAVVALTALLDPKWAEDPETAQVLRHPRLGREARIRLVFTVLSGGAAA